MHACIYSCSVIIICSSFSLLILCFFFLFGIFVSSLSITEKERRHRFIAVVFFFSLALSFSSAENTSCCCIYAYINQKKCERWRAFFFLYWPNLALILILSWFFYSLLHMPTYKNRPCIYIYYTNKKESSMVYIRERCIIIYP